MQIAIWFEYNSEYIARCKRMGAKWSNTLKCWYIAYNIENYNEICTNFSEIEILKSEYDTTVTQIEPAEIRQETVHIADNTAKLRHDSDAGHKEETRNNFV